jgi:hypothetical protein
VKTSWVIGVAMMYLFIFACELLATNGNMFNPSGINSLLSVSLSNSSGALAATLTFIGNLGVYFQTFLGMLFLYQPTVFSGNYIWLWLLLCLPIDIGMIFSVVSILRGVHSS